MSNVGSGSDMLVGQQNKVWYNISCFRDISKEILQIDIRIKTEVATSCVTPMQLTEETKSHLLNSDSSIDTISTVPTSTMVLPILLLRY